MICTAFGIINIRSIIQSDDCRINKEEAFLLMVYRISHSTTFEEEYGGTNDDLS